jgi:hypothetical protein
MTRRTPDEKRALNRARVRRFRLRQKLAKAPPSPVDYAISVMSDPAADPKRRDSMARALLAFLRGGGKLPEASPAPLSNATHASHLEGDAVEPPWTVLLGGKR